MTSNAPDRAAHRPGAQAVVAHWDWETIIPEFLKTFKDFPPCQKAASFTIDQAMEKMESSGALH